MNKKILNVSGFHEKLEDKNIQNGIIVSLVGACTIITIYFHIFLNISTVFTHFFYIPIILSALWWKRRGLLVTAFLSVVLIITRTDIALSFFAIEEDLFRIAILFFVSIVAILLSESMAYSQEAFKRISYQNKLILDSVGEGIYGVNKNGIVTFFNSFAEKTTGFSFEEAIGKNSHELMHHTKADGTHFPLEECTIHNFSILKGGSKRVTNELFWKKDGSSFPVEYIVTPIIKSGEINGAVVVFHDISDRIKMENALKNSEEKFREVFNKVNDIITLIELKADGRAGKYIEVNDVAVETLGYNLDEFLKMTPGDIGKKGEVTRDEVNILLNEGKVTFERTYITKDRIEIPVEINSHIFDFKGKKVALSVARDITYRRKAEHALRESEEKYRSLIESAKDPISVMDSNGIFLLANTAGAHSLNMEPYELIGKSLMDIFPESSEKQMEAVRKVFNTGKGLEIELPVEHEGVVGWYSASIQPLFGPENNVKSVQTISRDITDIMETQMKLKIALEEKEMLLKEIHHRVKNNLMIISSLLSIQSRFIKDKEALGIFKESQNRAKSMALIHERLYRSTDLKRIDMGEYIRTLANDLFHAYVTNDQKIEIKLDVEDIMVDINTSIPLGLIINEVITNALKHAFPNDMQGTILISFHRVGDKLKLEVSDDGIGFPKDLDYKNTSSMGLQLVNSLSNQIDAELNVILKKGTCFQITFPEKTF